MSNITSERLRQFTAALQKYKSGKANLERRVVSAENWWKLRNQFEERRSLGGGRDEGFRSASGWLHNVIVSKHADAMEAFPEPCILPREPGDRDEARLLSAVVPCILEQNRFEKTYSEAMWQKLKTGTACYRVVWDPEKCGGLGDIAIQRVDLLNLFWEPGVSDIQDSRYLFCTHLEDEESLTERYPQLRGRLRSSPFTATRFVYDDAVSLEGKVTVIEVYYKKRQGGKTVLHYCKYVGDTVLEATEDWGSGASGASVPVAGEGLRRKASPLGPPPAEAEGEYIPQSGRTAASQPPLGKGALDGRLIASPTAGTEAERASFTDPSSSERSPAERASYDPSSSERSPAERVREEEGRRRERMRSFRGSYENRGNEAERASSDAGLYDHGKYPFVFDPLFPVEGSPCGYGFVDLCANAQTAIDLMRSAFVKNALVGATPRYFQRIDGSVNEEEFTDLSRALVHVSGNLGEDSLRQIVSAGLPGVYVNVLESAIRELRETSGNTETATGTVNSGVTAASAIAALQEASGKGSRDATRASYLAFAEIVELCIELIRQFYTLPRQFRIAGGLGEDDFVSFSNAALLPRPQLGEGGLFLGMSQPVFDVKVSAQKRSAYSRLSQNELAMELYRMGLFDEGREREALSCLALMEFDGKDELAGRIAAASGLRKELTELARYKALALALLRRYRPELAADLSGEAMPIPPGPEGAEMPEPDSPGERESGAGELPAVPEEDARRRANEAPLP